MSATETGVWVQPKGYEFTSGDELEGFKRDFGVRKVVDPIDTIADDLFEAKFPGNLGDHLARQAFRAELLSSGVGYGTWFHDLETGVLARFAPQADHYAMRTNRNGDLIRREEQLELAGKRIAAFGLSVGSSAVQSSVQAGIGKHYMLFDHDLLSVANLNRLDAPYAWVGDLKTTIAGRKMSALDPYIEQSHFPEGYSRGSNDILRAMRPDVIIEEVDDMSVKAAIRDIAAELEVPVVMAGDVGDRTVLSVERYDQGPMKMFNGLISEQAFKSLLDGTMDTREQEGMLIKLIGIRNIPMRLLDSVPRIGKKDGLAGMPQLGATATVGGAVVATTIRDIILDRGTPSGRRVSDMRDIIGSNHAVSKKEAVRILGHFLKYRRDQKKDDK